MQTSALRIGTVILLVVGALLMPRAVADEPASKARIQAKQEMLELELTALKREYEALRVARVDHVRLMEFKRILKDSEKTKSLRQRELEEELGVMQLQLSHLDSMIAEASGKLAEAVFKKAQAEHEPEEEAPTPILRN